MISIAVLNNPIHYLSSLATIAKKGFRSIALRPYLSKGLPFFDWKLDYKSVNLQQIAQWPE